MSIADISLLNQDATLLVCIVSTTLLTLVLTQQSRHWRSSQLPYHLLGSFIVGVITWTFLWNAYPEDGMPLQIILWIALTLFATSILFTIKRSRRRLIIAGLSVFFAITTSLMLTNDYFQYYPTVGSIFTDNSGQDSTIETTNHSIAPTTTTESTYKIPADQPTTGQLVNAVIPGVTSHFTPRSEFIYLPPAARTMSPPALPVLTLLSGVPGSPDDWKNRLDLEQTLDNFAKLHRGLAPIVVIADQTGGNGFTSTGCVNSVRGNAETYLTIDVPAYIRTHYHTLPAPEGWAIGGTSDGGACSAILAVRHPDIFSTFMSLSGETSPSIESKQDAVISLFNGSMKDFDEYDTLLTLSSKNASSIYAHTAGWLAVGQDEQQQLIQANRALFNEAKTDNIDMVLETLPGHHGFNLWKRAFTEALPWISDHLGVTQ